MGTQEFRGLLAKGGEVHGAALSRIDWDSAQCADAALSDCVVEDAVLSGTVLSGARLVRCRFARCRFAHVDLRGAYIEECSFTDRGASVGSTFAFSELRESRFKGCDLSFCKFERSQLFAIEMNQCNLLGAKFVGADFSHSYGRKMVAVRATLRDCNLELAQLAGISLPGCELARSSFREADLSNADLTGADLRGCDLREAELESAKLEKADLRGAEFAGLNLLTLGSIKGMKINPDQQWVLLAGLGVDISTD